MKQQSTYTGFSDDRIIASGALDTVLVGVRTELGTNPTASILIFDDSTGKQVDFDLNNPPVEQAEAPSRGPGRPKLGVVAREVTLLPRHWDWLADQPSGASAALRRLVDAARKNETPRDQARRAAAAIGRIMTVLAGNRPNFEEAYRSLDAGDRNRFTELIRDWPEDIRTHLLTQAESAFAPTD